jgi:solute carrier family 25 citrate transporter 1
MFLVWAQRLTHAQVKRRGFLATGKEIVKRETPLGLYKGLGAVVTGIVPKMAIRFTSYEFYKGLMADKDTGKVSGKATFLGMYQLPIEVRRKFY